MFVTDKLGSLIVDSYIMAHILNPHDHRSAQIHNNLFALTVCLQVTPWQNFWIDNQMSLYFNYAIKADKKRKLKLKISYAIYKN